jgi:hypothetical protein
MSVSFSEQVSTSGSSSLTAKGQILTHDGTSAIGVSVGTNGQIVSAQSSATSGLSYITINSSTAIYALISSTSLSASATSITFGTIPSSYRHLELVFFGAFSGATDAQLGIRINGDTSTTVYRTKSLYSNIDNSQSGNSYAFIGVISSPSSTVGARLNVASPASVIFFNYNDTTYHKIALANSMYLRSDLYPQQVSTGIQYNSASAITSVSLVGSAGGFSTNSYAALYGIKS